MFNPFNPQQDPGLSSYVNLQSRILRNVQASQVNDRIFEVMKKAYEEALRMENVKLAPFEKKHLLSEIMRQVLADRVRKIDDSYKA